MIKHLKNIFNLSKSSKFAFSALVLIMFCCLPAFVEAQDKAQLGKDCDAGNLPPLTTDANCKTSDCETRKGCLDAAPAAPINRVSSDFGPRKDPLGTRYKGEKGHGAVDFAAPKGAPIYAAADGKISRIDTSNPNGYGNRVQIIHDNGYETLYAHMNCFASYDGKRLKAGQRVKKGTVIGFVGNTGSSTGPHLHYEVRVAGTMNKKDPHGKDMQGVMCKVPSPSQYTKTDVPPNGVQSSGGAGNGSGGGGCSSSGCAKMYPADDISELHHKYEAGGNPCAFNKCASGDPGSCSYGSSQLACGKEPQKGSMAAFLKNIKSNSTLWNALGGGSVAQMVNRACTAPATEFANKWKNLCNGSLKNTINDAQQNYMQSKFYDSSATYVKQHYGVDFNAMSPELQMALYSAAVALGPAGGGVKNLMESVKNNCGAPKTLSEEALLECMYKRRDYFYGSSSPKIRESVQRRNAREGAEAVESMKIRKAWEAEKAKPSNPPKTYEQIVQEITGKTACAAGQSGKFDCSASGASGEGSGAKGYENKTCSPSEYKSTYGSCLFCPLFQVVFNTASKIAKLSFNKLSTPVMTVVLIAWAIWIAMQILTFVSSLETKDAPTLIKTLLNKTFVVLIVVVILKADSSTFFSLAMEPIFNTGFKLAQMAVTDGTCTSTYNILPDGGLPASMGTSILCTIEAIQGRLMATMSLGAASICIAFYVKATLFIFPSLPYLITGILIWCGAGIVIIIFPFLMLDAIFQLTVACALLPAAIGCYPFKSTQQYVGHVWNSFMNAMYNFVFLSIIILILTKAIEITVTGSGVDELTDENFQEAIVTTLAWGGVAVIKIVFVLLLAWAILDEASDFAGKFAGSLTQGGIGRQIGGMAAMGTKKLGLKAWGGAKAVGGAVGENIKEKVGDFRRDLTAKRLENKAIQQGAKRVEVKDDQGNVIGYSYEVKSKSWARNRNKTETITVMNNGTKMVTTTKDYGGGKIVTTRSDGYLTQTETSVNGEVTKSDISIQTAGLKAIRNRDGTMNMTALNAAMKNSAFSEKMIKAAALQQYAKQSFPGLNTDFNMNEENIEFGTDEQGRQVLEIVNEQEGNAPKILRLTMPAAGETGRPLVELEQTERKDGKIKTTRHATDGMMNHLRETKIDAKTGKEETIDRYAVSGFYAKKSTYPVDSHGQFLEIFERNGGTAFGAEDQEKMRKQFLKNRLEGKPSKINTII